MLYVRQIKSVLTAFVLVLGSPLSHAACDSYLVQSLIPGLYESVPFKRKFSWEGYHFATSRRSSRGANPTTRVETFVRDDNVELVAMAETSFSQDRVQMLGEYVNTVDHYSNRPGIPSFVDVPDTIPLVAGRGIPTPVFLYLYHMKIAGVRFGGLRLLCTSRITNLVTACELGNRHAIAEWIKTHPHKMVPLHMIAQEFWATNTGRFLATIITQSGGRVLNTEFSGGMVSRVEDLYAGQLSHAKLVSAQGDLSERDFVPYNFKLTVTIGPAAAVTSSQKVF